MRRSHTLSKLAAIVAAAALVVVTAGAALADPPSQAKPDGRDLAGMGSAATQFLLDQLGYTYDHSHEKSGAFLYSWDAVNPVTGQVGDQIVTKLGCAGIARPDSSSAGITALEANTPDRANPADYCLDFARSDRGRRPGDPPCATGGICFLPLAGDAVTYATRDAASGGTNAPASLTTAQLASIYKCKVGNWDQVGGPDAPIDPFLPRTSSETRASFLTALGGGTPITPGACVSDARNTLLENQGVNPKLDDPNAIFPYAVSAYIAQVYHSAACTSSACTGSPACAPSGEQNMFGCDEHGVLGLNEINGTAPATPWPLPAPPASPAINTKFTARFQHTVYDVVRYDPSTADHIPSYLEPVFAAAGTSRPGWICSSSAAASLISDYGFLLRPACTGTGPSPPDVWTVRPSPANFTAKQSADLALMDTTSGNTISTCAASAMTPSFTSPATGQTVIGSIATSNLTFGSCTSGPGKTSATVTEVAYSLSLAATAFDKDGNTVTGIITGIRIQVTVAGSAACTATIGRAGGDGKGTVQFTYEDVTRQFTLATAGGNLEVRRASPAGGICGTPGDSVSLSGSYVVPKGELQIIYQ